MLTIQLNIMRRFSFEVGLPIIAQFAAVKDNVSDSERSFKHVVNFTSVFLFFPDIIKKLSALRRKNHKCIFATFCMPHRNQFDLSLLGDEIFSRISGLQYKYSNYDGSWREPSLSGRSTKTWVSQGNLQFDLFMLQRLKKFIIKSCNTTIMPHPRIYYFVDNVNLIHFLREDAQL